MLRRWLLFIVLGFALSGCGKSHSNGVEVTLAAATSLRAVMPELMAKYSAGHPNVRLTVSYGASGDLRQQVEGGAPIDVVVFASGKPVDDLVRLRLADGSSKRVIATNQLVLIGPKGGKPYTFATIDTVAPGDKIAIGDPKTVPAGQYAQGALQKLGKWDAVQDRLVFGGDVAGVLAYARRGEVAAAIVYKTEIRGIDDVVAFDELKGDAAPRAEVVAAVITGARSTAEARAFVDFLASTEALGTIVNFGFGTP
jgi:molybdate transport system substrate-binding protein